MPCFGAGVQISYIFLPTEKNSPVREESYFLEKIVNEENIYQFFLVRRYVGWV